jgi:hypothetical protein
MAATHKKDAKHGRRKLKLPEPGKKKKNPRDLDKLLDQGIEDSMKASDPPAVVQPEVHTEPERDPEQRRQGGP